MKNWKLLIICLLYLLSSTKYMTQKDGKIYSLGDIDVHSKTCDYKLSVKYVNPPTCFTYNKIWSV